MTPKIRIAGALVAPLLLAGCGLPVGVQIASLLADGVSVWTTEKTLTDHGLSAVTDKDCSLWRTVEGQDICRDADDSATALADAAAATKAEDQAAEQQDWGATAAAEKQDKEIARRETPEFPTEDPAAADAAPSPSTPAVALAPITPAPVETVAQSWTPVTSVETAPPPAETFAQTAAATPAAPVAVPQPVALVRNPAAPPKAVPAAVIRAPKAPVRRSTRQTYYVIASYHRASGAKRFSRRHSRLEPVVLEGTAKGRKVFRVAIGPVAREGRKTTKLFLKNRGFGDAWALTLKTRKPATEVAALR